jgi:hypothetical protein
MVSNFGLRILDLFSDIRQERHKAGAFDGVLNGALECGAGAAPFPAIQLALAGAEFLQPLHVLVIDVGWPGTTFFCAKPTTILAPSP